MTVQRPSCRISIAMLFVPVTGSCVISCISCYLHEHHFGFFFLNRVKFCLPTAFTLTD